jgi:hypothetical protein
MKTTIKIIAGLIRELGILKGVNSKKFTALAGAAGIIIWGASEAQAAGWSDTLTIGLSVIIAALAAWYIHSQGMIDRVESAQIIDGILNREAPK